MTKKSGYLLALDYQKAFDSISKEFMLETLDVYGFGDKFKQWVRVLVKDTFSSVNHGGWISDTIPLKCRIRQGCPFSPLVFILAVELLAIKIRNNKISGI